MQLKVTLLPCRVVLINIGATIIHSILSKPMCASKYNNEDLKNMFTSIKINFYSPFDF